MEPVHYRRPRSGGDLRPGPPSAHSCKQSEGPWRNEEDHVEAASVPSQQRADTLITCQAEGNLRGLGTGAVIKYLLLSQRERQRLLGLDKQEETGIWQTPCLPPPLLGGISLEGKNVLITPCMPGALPGLRYAHTNTLPILPGPDLSTNSRDI